MHRVKRNRKNGSSKTGVKSPFIPRRFFHTITSVTIFLACILALGWAFRQNPVQRIQWHGTRFLDVNTVESRLAPFFQPNTPLWDIPVRPILNELTRYPVVENVAVRKRWPATIDIYVQERIPYLIIRDPEGFKIVDKKGVYFGRAQGHIRHHQLRPIVRLHTPLPDRWAAIWKIRPIIERLRVHDTWLLERMMWLHLQGDYVIFELDDPPVQIILADHNDFVNPKSWPRVVETRLGFLTQHWNSIVEKLDKSRKEIDLRFRNQIIIR